jgi:uncharacterized protein
MSDMPAAGPDDGPAAPEPAAPEASPPSSPPSSSLSDAPDASGLEVLREDEARGGPLDPETARGRATEADVEAPSAEGAPSAEAGEPARDRPREDEGREAGAAAPAGAPGEAAPGPAATEGTPAGRPKPAERALERLRRAFSRVAPGAVGWLVGALDHGVEPSFLARFRREESDGLDERRIRELRDAWSDLLSQERRRDEVRSRVERCGALTPDLERALDDARTVPEMEDLAAAWLPVPGGRATVARGRGLGALAEAIRDATSAETPLADLAKPFLKEGSEVTTLDGALSGARDVLAEEIALDARLRGRLRDLFRRESVLAVSLRDDRRGDAGRHGAFVGFASPLAKVPPMKMLAIRRGERERVLATTIEPPEEHALALVHASLGKKAAEHPFAGFLRAAAEDAYRRILRPMLQQELRLEAKARADAFALDGFERALRNLLLGPVGGARRTLGVVPDVTGGHRCAAVDDRGRFAWAGRLPHEPTAGREPTLASLRDLLRAHGIEAVAVASSAGRKEALALAREAAGEGGVEVVEVADGGTRAAEQAAVAAPTKAEGVEVPPEFTGALSVARRFQDPLAEYVRLDPKSLGLGPHVHDVHQGRLQALLDDVVESCVAHAGVDATTADAALLSRVPGLDDARAKAFVAWREAGNALPSKAALAAVEGVGPAAAERAVGFLRVPNARDPRDRTMLHPEQFGLLERMAEQVGADLAGLFREPRLRARVDLGRLAKDGVPMPVLRYALYQATAGAADPRPRHATPVRPPEGFGLASIRPGLMLEGKVVRAAPFGVFLDVGLETEALVPIAHIGDRPGVEPSTVAPVGAVVHGRVIEIDPVKKRVTLSMREDVLRGPPRDARAPRGPGRPPGGAPRGGRGPRERAGAGEGPPRPEPLGVGAASNDGPAAGRGRGPRAFGPDAPKRGDRGGRGTPSRDRGAREGGAKPISFSAMVRPTRDTPGAGWQAGGRRGDDRRSERDDTGAPRRISIPAEGEAGAPAEGAADEASLTPEQLLARKLEELKKRLARPE